MLIITSNYILLYCSVTVHGTDVFNSPFMAGFISGSGHEDFGLTAWHHVFLGDGKVLAANIVVSIEVSLCGPGGNLCGKS